MTATPTLTRTRPTLEQLVDRLIAAFLAESPANPPAASPARVIHEARQQRRAGELESALTLFARLELAQASESELGWASAEFLALARRRFGAEALLYRPTRGRAAVLTPHADCPEGLLEVRAVLGLRWPVGKLVSRRSLRGLRTLRRGDGS